jgi:methyltransferase family protein
VNRPRLATILTWLRALPWIARSLVLDLRFGASLVGNVSSRHRDAGGHNVANTPYSVLPHVFAGRIRAGEVLVDVGCGKGRVINWWLSQGLTNRIVGLEMDAEIAAATAKRLRRYSNVTIVNADATTAVPGDATLLYLYNPFDGAATERFKANLVARFGDRGITLLYWNAQYIEVFERDSRWRTHFVDLGEVGDPRIGGTHGRYAVVTLEPERVRRDRARRMARPLRVGPPERPS